MSINKVATDAGQQKLMQAISELIRVHTTHTPMTLQSIVGVLAFVAGAAIIRGADTRTVRRQLRELAVANIDCGMDAMRAEGKELVSSLLLPMGLQ